MLPTLRTYISSQRGAMFGVDARIALAIFGALSIIAGAYTAMSMHTVRAQSLSQEMEGIAQAIEAIQYDTKEDLFNILLNPTDSNAFIALYDRDALADGRPKGRWLGPYITASSPIHPRYGFSAISKRGPNINQDCYAEEICYLWMTYDNVALNIVQELNKIFDGEQEQLGDATGRVQWKEGQNEAYAYLWFRASKAFSANMAY